MIAERTAQGRVKHGEAEIGGDEDHDCGAQNHRKDLLLLASRPGLIGIINRWHLEHAAATKVVLAAVVIALGFAILLTV